MIAVVKLGGSLLAAGTLGGWLAALAAGPEGVVIVPGGGPFADAVRAAQALMGFSDPAAHRMALLAMHQMALLIADRLPGAMPCDSDAAIRAALERGAVPVWLPGPMVEADPAIAESWDVTSDSLAAWLASRLGAARLVLVKSAPPPPPPLMPARLAALGFVDEAFPRYAAMARWELRCRGPGEEALLAADLRLPQVAHGAAGG